MTHLYTILVGGTVIAGRDAAPVTAIAWAGDTVIALGSDADVRSISRGDSHVIELRGAAVVPLGEGSDTSWPVTATLEVGGPADMAVVERDPLRRDTAAGPPPLVLAVIRDGRVVAGGLPGDAGGERRGHGHPMSDESEVRSD